MATQPHHAEWQATNDQRPIIDHASSLASSSSSESSHISARGSTQTPSNDVDYEDVFDHDKAWLDTISSSSSSTRRVKHIINHAVLLGISAFLGVSLLTSMMLSRPKIISSDNTFATLPQHMQSRLGMPALRANAQHDLTMSDAGCQREFPLLLHQLNSVQAYWEQRGGIKRQLIETNDASQESWGHARLIIRDGQQYIRTFREGEETRNSALVHLFAQAVAKRPSGDEPLAPIDMVLSAGDRDFFPEEGGWGVTRNINDSRATGRWLAPDFGFVGWPEAGIASWGEFMRDSAEEERIHPWSNKSARAFWRGFPNIYAVRQDLLQRTKYGIDAERETWADVRTTTFGKIHEGDGNVPLVSPAQHCRNRYLVHVEGNSYSGRSRYLFSCNAVTIAHPLEWTQHFHPALNADPKSADQNFVQLAGPFFDGLEETVQALRLTDGIDVGQSKAQLLEKKPAIAQALADNSARKIADNAVRTLRNRYLTPAATMCYTRAALRHYAASMNRTTWEAGGPTLLPGSGVAPGASKGRPMTGLHGDIEVGIWRLLGSPNWPPT